MLTSARILSSRRFWRAAIVAAWSSVYAADPAAAALIDTVFVPADGALAVSSVSLDAGTHYTLRASGTILIAGHAGAGTDAEYFIDGMVDYCLFGGVSICDYGIAINDPTVGGLKLPFWGPYSPTHQYTIDFTGLGAPLTFRFHDDHYLDNSGSLTVEIFTIAVAEPAGLVLLGLFVPVVLAARRRVGAR